MSDAYEHYKLQADSTALVTSEMPATKKPRTDYQKYVDSDDDEPVNADDSELGRYYAEKKATSDTCPLEWWKFNAKDYPTLSKMARDYFSVQASSVPSEELFSSGVDLVTADRASITAENISSVMCLKYWLKKSQ
jgi:hypothetical protein